MTTWMGRAACAETPLPELFFPPSAVLAPVYLKDARTEYCDTCPVKTECLNYAIDNGFEGIWAGTTDGVRRAMRRRRQPSRSPR